MMRTRAGQRRALEAMEATLDATQPRLAAMFAIFNRLTEGEDPVGIERISIRRAWASGWPSAPAPARPLGVVIMLAAATLAVLVTGVLLGTSASGAATNCGGRLHGLGYITSRSLSVRRDAPCTSGPDWRVVCPRRISATRPLSC